ncbi:hypothetical protein CANINC_000545 [Pichia inconspicua]|uniref:Impact N-terminal domain-containing protein n=1 Tax=Pichia inconspicua TaxID=52247 RepID=A0A4T0X5U6_9ASCO|nr:hypothetical protein CANINC_000545 [[Candida] inconspicua]
MRPITSSTVHVLKKSKFRGFCVPIQNGSEVPNLLRQICGLDKNIPKASHPTMYAWKTANSNPDCSPILNKLINLNQGFNDCNEGGAGLRILGMLDRIHLVNILVVVTRWYGGTPLGPARFKCISDAGLDALREAGFMDFKSTVRDKTWIDCLNVDQKR